MSEKLHKIDEAILTGSITRQQILDAAKEAAPLAGDSHFYDALAEYGDPILALQNAAQAMSRIDQDKLHLVKYQALLRYLQNSPKSRHEVISDICDLRTRYVDISAFT